MKKYCLTVIFALVLSLCLVSCDTIFPNSDTSGTETADVDGSEKTTSGSTEGTQETIGETTNNDDTQETDADEFLPFEVAANEALKTDKISIKNSSLVIGYDESDISLVAVTTVIESMVNGKNAFATTTQQTANFDGSVTTVASSTTQIKTETGYNFFVTSSVDDSNMTSIFMNVGDAEYDAANQQAVAVQGEVMLSVGDFDNVEKIEEDGVTTYICSSVKKEKANKIGNLINSLTSALAGPGISVDVIESATTWTVSLENGKFISSVFHYEYDMTFDLGNGEKMSVLYVYDGLNEYDYNEPVITAPEDWDYDTDIEMTWEQYWAAVAQ